MERDWKFYLFKFIHNFLIHPLLAFPVNESKWKIGKLILKAHDYTSKRCPGAG